MRDRGLFSRSTGQDLTLDFHELVQHNMPSSFGRVFGDGEGSSLKKKSIWNLQLFLGFIFNLREFKGKKENIWILPSGDYTPTYISVTFLSSQARNKRESCNFEAYYILESFHLGLFLRTLRERKISLEGKEQWISLLCYKRPLPQTHIHIHARAKEIFFISFFLKESPYNIFYDLGE